MLSIVDLGENINSLFRSVSLEPNRVKSAHRKHDVLCFFYLEHLLWLCLAAFMQLENVNENTVVLSGLKYGKSLVLGDQRGLSKDSQFRTPI